MPTDIRTVNKAEKIEQRHCRHDHKVNLETKLAFGHWIDLDQSSPISMHFVSIGKVVSPKVHYSPVCCGDASFSGFMSRLLQYFEMRITVFLRDAMIRAEGRMLHRGIV